MSLFDRVEKVASVKCCYDLLCVTSNETFYQEPSMTIIEWSLLNCLPEESFSRGVVFEDKGSAICTKHLEFGTTNLCAGEKGVVWCDEYRKTDNEDGKKGRLQLNNYEVKFNISRGKHELRTISGSKQGRAPRNRVNTCTLRLEWKRRDDAAMGEKVEGVGDTKDTSRCEYDFNIVQLAYNAYMYTLKASIGHLP
ncbi:hypothetical protein GOBAR_AA25053 [Gossypium barbadense]|uniref:Uncharacterized protein n=1 Tax=Gossypium barbadense TaxID=3634 RepID=A0A2P5WWZ6_GOSBA|nr:hypothetical protein GOBAR_AA25053 [Gossypium barbadense]